MKQLRAYELSDGGAIIVDTASGCPVPIPLGRFRDEADAEAFLVWHGEHCGDVYHLRDAARRWQEVRDWLPCPTCPEGAGGRVAPGQAVCHSCAADIEFSRRAS